jgi:hypothetical protein
MKMEPALSGQHPGAKHGKAWLEKSGEVKVTEALGPHLVISRQPGTKSPREGVVPIVEQPLGLDPGIIAHDHPPRAGFLDLPSLIPLDPLINVVFTVTPPARPELINVLPPGLHEDGHILALD